MNHINLFNNIASTIPVPFHARTNFSGNNFILPKYVNLKNHPNKSIKFLRKAHKFNYLKKEDSGSFLTSSLKTIKKLGFSFFNKTLSNVSSFVYAKKIPSAQARRIQKNRLKQEKIINKSSSNNKARIKRDVERDKAPSAQARRIQKNRLKQEKIINKNSINDVRVKRGVERAVDINCMNALFKIGHNQPLVIEEKHLQNLKCNFSKENGEPNILNERILVKDIYKGVEIFFTNFIKAKEDKDLTLIDKFSKDLFLNYKRFNLLSFMVFNSEKHVPSAVINEYLTAFNKLLDQFWEIEDKETNNKTSQLQKSELRKILDDHLNYKLIERCAPNECNNIYAGLENSVGFSFLSPTSLYTTKEEWNGFLEKYLNYWKQVLEKVPDDRKDVIRNNLVQYFQNFFEAKGSAHERVQDLKKQLNVHGNDLKLRLNGQPFCWSATTTQKPTTTTTTRKPTTTTTTTTRKPTTTTESTTQDEESTTQDTTIEAIASVSTDRTSTTQVEESTTQDTTTEAIASVSTDRTSTTQVEENITQDTTTEAIASVSTDRTSTTQVEENITQDTTTEEIASVSTGRTSPIQVEESTTQDTTIEAIASVSTDRTSTIQVEESTTQDTTIEAIASVSTERTSPIQVEERTTQDTATEAIASVSTERTSPIQVEESTTQDITTEEVTSGFTAAKFKRSTIEDSDVIFPDTTEKVMVVASPQNFIAKTVVASVGMFLGLLAFLGFAIARKKKSGVYRTGEEMKSLNDSFTVDFSDSEEETQA